MAEHSAVFLILFYLSYSFSVSSSCPEHLPASLCNESALIVICGGAVCEMIWLDERPLEKTCFNLLDCTKLHENSGSCLLFTLCLSPCIFCLFFSLSDSAIVNGVFWSEALNKVFVDNFERDPSLIWQYFGSAKGFFRQYPGEWMGSRCVCVCVCGMAHCYYPKAIATPKFKIWFIQCLKLSVYSINCPNTNRWLCSVNTWERFQGRNYVVEFFSALSKLPLFYWATSINIKSLSV